MVGPMIELTASDGHTFAAYRAEPTDTPRGGIVVVQEIFGVNHHIRSVADAFAADGYLVLAPSLFDRVERNVELDYSPAGVARGRELRSKLTIEAALADVVAATTAASAAGKVGIVGYCWGGFVTWMAAAKVDGLACAVAYYGGGILDHAEVRLRCPVMCHFGQKDTMIPVDGVKQLATLHPAHEVHLYDADHGFNCNERGSYDAAAATLARERTLGLFRTHVG
jgi:carboxymethylenebutenolidase